MTGDRQMKRRLLCRLFGHKRRTVTAMIHSDGTRRYISHPFGEYIGCRRCRRVLKDG